MGYSRPEAVTAELVNQALLSANRLMKIIRIITYTALSIFFALIVFVVALLFSDGPEFSKFDAARIKSESEALLNDEAVEVGFVSPLPDKYVYLNSIEPSSIYKRSDIISVTIWQFWVSEKRFVLFASREEADERVKRTLGWTQIDGLFYTHVDDG